VKVALGLGSVLGDVGEIMVAATGAPDEVKV
jgi:hypothetical protein